METVYKINLRFSLSTQTLSMFHAVQGDNGTRKIEATILADNGQPYDIASGITAKFVCKKSDGTGTEHSTGVSISGSVVTVELSEQDLACPGRVYAAIVLMQGEDELTTFPFWYQVEPRPVGADVRSQNDYEAYNKALDALSNAPIIDSVTNHWETWSVDQEQYIDTGVIASGEGAVSYAIEQSLTDTQKSQARVNIDAASETDVSDLKDDMTDISGNHAIQMIDGGYIVTSATAIDINTVVPSINCRYAIVDCAVGDKFTINAQGTAQARAFAIIKSDGTLIENSGTGTLVLNQVITIPEEGAKLVINDTGSYTSFYGYLLKDKVDNLIDSSKAFSLIWENGSIASSSGRSTSNGKRIRTQYIDVTPGENIIAVFDSETIAYLFYYSDTTYNAYVGYIQLERSGMYAIPTGVNYIRIVLGNANNIDTSYSNHLYLSRPESAQAVHLAELQGTPVNLTWTSGYYKRIDDIYETTGDWGCSNNIPCSPGDYLLIKNSYAVDFRAILFYDQNNVCTGIYEGEKNTKIETVLTLVPDKSSYCILNTKYSTRDTVTVNVIQTTLTIAEDALEKMLHGIAADTGYKLYTIFKTAKAAGPLFTIVDDDGRNLYQVSKFHEVCTANNVIGCNALATKFIDNMATSDKETFLATLKSYEQDGFENVLHCYDHDYWESTIKSTMTDDEIFAAVTSDMARGIREMEEYGFRNWKHWVVPQGKTNLPNVETVARNMGFLAAYDVSNNTYNRFIPRGRQFHRYNIPRLELYPNDTANPEHTLQLIKDQADLCANEGGWLIVCTHFYQSGWSTDDPTYSRVSEMIQYIMGLGYTNVTLSGGMSYWEDIYRIYDLF